jgi:uncharacterized membrane protein YhiD involved in acid resistance
VVSSKGNDPNSWDARWLAQISDGADRRQTSRGLTNGLAAFHGLIVVGLSAATGTGFYLALSATTLIVLVVRAVTPVVSRCLARRRDREVPSPFGR